MAAERDMAAAAALVKGKTTRGAGARHVLPEGAAAEPRRRAAPDLREASCLARKANVKFEERRSDIDLQQQRQKNTRLGRLQTRIVLEGDYESLRQLLYELETTPEFLIVDDVGVTQPEANKALTLTLDVSTYYRVGANGA